MDINGFKNEYSKLVYGDFTGGLKNTSLPELISQNELSECLNMELDRTTASLSSCVGTAIAYKPKYGKISHLWWDEINNCFLFCDMDTRKIYRSNIADIDGTMDDDCIEVGELTGTEPPMVATWEYGLLIASGGELQYWDGELNADSTQAIVKTVTKPRSFEDDLADGYWRDITLTSNGWLDAIWVTNKMYHEGDAACLLYGIDGVEGQTTANYLNDANRWFICIKSHISNADDFLEPSSDFDNYFGLNQEYWAYYPHGGAWQPDTAYTTNQVVAMDVDDDKTHTKCYVCVTSHTSAPYQTAEEAEANADDEDTSIKANGVFVRDGRVYIWHDYKLECSAVGDETSWTNNPNDPSSAQWLYVGYKEGEEYTSHIRGVCALSSDIVIIKEDGKIYRLTGTAGSDDWTLKEVARHIPCLSKYSYCNIQDAVFILGQNTLFALQTTENYGDVYPINIAQNVAGLVQDISGENSKLEYIPSLNQLWMINETENILVYDLNYKVFFNRRFNSPIRDVTCAKQDVFLSTDYMVSLLWGGVYVENWLSDKESAMQWRFKARTNKYNREAILRRTKINYIALDENIEDGDGEIITADDKIKIPIKPGVEKPLAMNEKFIISDNMLVFNVKMQYKAVRSTYRNEYMTMRGEGTDCPVMIYNIEQDIAEVGSW